MIEKRHEQPDEETLGSAVGIFPTRGSGNGIGKGYANGRSGGHLLAFDDA